jgi:hypothetical protein
MNVPLSMGRFNATVPLAELLIDDQALTLRARSFLGGFSPFIARLDQIDAAYRLRGVVMTAGVGIRLRNGVVAYFWTWTQMDAVLAALADRGITIEPGAHRARGLWSLRGTEGDVIVPTLPTVLQTLAPVLALVGTAAAIVLTVLAGSLGFRVVIGLVWALSMVSTFGLWREGRRTQNRT